MLTLLTATGCRPEAWALCERWMARQTYRGPVRWIIVDDGQTAQPVTFARDGWSVEVVRPQPWWQPGQNTQQRNMLAGLDRVTDTETLVIIEDDDWYSPQWLGVVAQHIKPDHIFGETRARYYNVRTAVYRQIANNSHASLCSTATHGRGTAALRRACATKERYIDMSLWRSHPMRILRPGANVVGIKGLPGRDGIGMGHRPQFSGPRDSEHKMLRRWLGDDAGAYA